MRPKLQPHAPEAATACARSCNRMRAQAATVGAQAATVSAGASPTFVGCSATIASPCAHFALLTGLSAQRIAAVADDGAPRGDNPIPIPIPIPSPSPDSNPSPTLSPNLSPSSSPHPNQARRAASVCVPCGTLQSIRPTRLAPTPLVSGRTRRRGGRGGSWAARNGAPRRRP